MRPPGQVATRLFMAALLLAGCALINPSAAPASAPDGSAPPSGTGTQPSGSASTTPSLSSTALSSLIHPDALAESLAAFQSIADESDGNRAAGTVGYERSVEYVTRQLTAAGYEVSRQEFSAGGTVGWNLIVERAGTGQGVLIVGAHLDSVAVGPGMNDNASGAVALLALAEALIQLPPPSLTIRFAFWGAEENGPHGSQAYVDSLAPAAVSEIRAYLNVDMIGSPNGLAFVYDEPGAAPGSEAVTNVVSGYFRQRGRPWEPIDLAGDSDHGPFSAAGVATGGLFAGGREPVTADQAPRHGAIAGQPADPCSHQACDTLDNVSLARLALMTDALGAAIVTLSSGPSS